jgi:hypothetical protein
MALKQTIRTMISNAQRTGQPVRTHLAKGLTIALKITGDLADVQLSRAKIYPSTIEWKTVISQWPGQCVVVKEPKSLKDTTTYYLKGQLRMVPELIEE